MLDFKVTEDKYINFHSKSSLQNSQAYHPWTWYTVLSWSSILKFDENDQTVEE